MKVTVCLGSECHKKGARRVVEQLQYLIAKHDLDDAVELGGAFCVGVCQHDVCVTVEDKLFSVSPESVKEFFENEILEKLN